VGGGGGGGGEGAHGLGQVGDAAAGRSGGWRGEQQAGEVVAAGSRLGRWSPACIPGRRQPDLPPRIRAGGRRREERSRRPGRGTRSSPGAPWLGTTTSPKVLRALTGRRRGLPPRPWGGRPRGGPLGRRWEGICGAEAEAARSVSREEGAPELEADDDGGGRSAPAPALREGRGGEWMRWPVREAGVGGGGAAGMESGIQFG
jgi:hypothetical protein